LKRRLPHIHSGSPPVASISSTVIAELNQRSNRLGHALIAAGVGLDQPVALLAERNLDLLGMIIGSFKAGAGICRWIRVCRLSA
jgi:non-ribosomal peptide synthetase component F